MGIQALLYTWLVTEIAVTIYVVYLNYKLFTAYIPISIAPMWRFLSVLAISFGLAAWPTWHDLQWPVWKVIAAALFVSTLLACISYFSFGVGEVRALLGAKLRRRLATSAF